MRIWTLKVHLFRARSWRKNVYMRPTHAGQHTYIHHEYSAASVGSVLDDVAEGANATAAGRAPIVKSPAARAV